MTSEAWPRPTEPKLAASHRADCKTDGSLDGEYDLVHAENRETTRSPKCIRQLEERGTQRHVWFVAPAALRTNKGPRGRAPGAKKRGIVRTPSVVVGRGSVFLCRRERANFFDRGGRRCIRGLPRNLGEWRAKFVFFF